MAYWVALFMIHDRLDLARQLTQDPYLRRTASGIIRWVISQAFHTSPYWCFNRDYVYYRVIAQLVTMTNSTIIRRFLALRQDHNDDIEFILTTQQRNEYVWSCGLSPTSDRIGRHTEFGFNLYGRIMTKVYHQWLNQSIFEIPPIVDSLVSMKAWDVDCYRATVLVLSDSQCRQLQSIEQGKVIAVSGGRYDSLADALRRSNVRPRHFKYVVVSCGVNLCRRNDARSWYRSWNRLRRTLVDVINCSSHHIILNLPILTNRFRFVRQHIDFMRDLVQDIDNLSIVDWSQQRDNPFIGDNLQCNPEFFCSDQFHVNHMGFRQFWSAWCEHHNELTLISYKLSILPYQQN